MITLRPLSTEDLKPLWYIAYQDESPQWAQLNAPFLDEFQMYTYDEFLVEEAQLFLHMEDRYGIFFENELIGIVHYHWESLSKRYLETGIIIYTEKYWGKGIGFTALKLWHKHLIKTFPELNRISITTWSGNPAMIALSEKLNMKLFERINNAHVYKGNYYDSVRYRTERT